MEKITELIKNWSSVQIIDLLIAVGIILVFRFSSTAISYILIKMLKLKSRNSKKIKESAFYNPIRVFFNILGVYLAILFLKESLKISEEVMNIITKIFEILSVLTFAKGLAKSFTSESSLVQKIKVNMNEDIQDSMFDFILKLIRTIIYVIAGFIIISILGINLNGLIAGLSAGGVIITLIAQETIKNLVGGLVIFLDKPFIVGDWIEVDKYEGTVEDITFRSTRIRTFENSLVNIPNSLISNSSIINWSKMEKRRYKTTLCIQIDTPIEKLEKFKSRVEEMLQDRKAIYDDSIIVKFDEIGSNGLEVLICSYTGSVDYPTYISEKEKINYKLMKILREENIELAYDTKTVYTKHIEK